MTGGEFVSVRLVDLSPDPDQPRKVFDEESLAGLARTLESGQLQPILAYRRDDRLVILDGERRWRAARLAGLKTVQVLIVEPPEPERALEFALVANLQRDDLSPIEKARAIARLMEATESPAARVAGRLGLSPASVSRLLALLQLPESVQAKVESGNLAASTAYELARQGEAADQERRAAEIVEGKLTRNEVAGRRRTAKRGSTRNGQPATRLVAELGGGRSVAVAGAGLDSIETLIAWLEELLARARKARPRSMELSTFASLLRDEAKACRPGRGKKQAEGGNGS